MPPFCHRCQRELPGHLAGGPATGSAYDEQRALFCPFCGAPQLRLAEELRASVAPARLDGDSEASTAVPPPPLPGGSHGAPTAAVDWAAALSSGLPVAAIGAVLIVLGLRLPAASFLGTMWVVGAPVLALGLYARRRPHLALDGRAGVRVGVATGVMLVALMAAGLALAGVVARFGLHGMQGFDGEVGRQMEQTRQQLALRMQEQGQNGGQNGDFERHMLRFLAADEVRGGLAVLYAATLGVIVLVFSAAGGAFAGVLHRVRQTAARRAGL